MRVDLIVGARPNFPKAAPIHRALRASPDEFAVRLVHTGQHYDYEMSDVFFRDLHLPAPDVHLEVGSADQGAQTGEIMIRYEGVFTADPADVVLVMGDVNSTVACALVAVKKGAAVGHVEAGLRSFDRTMPEEVNRIVTDRVSDFLFTPSADGNENLRAEGVPGSHVFLVGNIMIDSLVASMPEVERSTVLARLGLSPRSYGVLTLHRPSNVDDLEQLADILASLATIQEAVRFVFPVHPRTREMLTRFGDSNPLDRMPNVVVTAPLGYRDFLRLERDAALVMTDSGGIQEESTFLGIPCLTLRENTERPITISDGTNLLIGRDGKRLVAEVRKILAGGGKTGRVPPLWDGRTAERIADVLRAHRRGDLPKRPWGPTPPGAAGGARRVG